ncbi:hypothetical protein EDD80_10513 [Anseongella ginsenosidimutans]|uniref:Uncharacterized protein n=1 Tax=Anseongella ginsenosidimutans TaxID=496056 RepID=A0A4R3KQK9_9SPHI|nr:hypothetical protein EDD80_10513 [Anseongella ginsenosidimutans]
MFKGKKTSAFSKARKELQKLVDLINPDDVNMEKVRDFSSLPAFQHLDPDFQLEINLIPKPERSRIDDQRNIGVFETQTRVGGFGNVLHDAIKRKAARYGKVGKPFMLAIMH